MISEGPAREVVSKPGYVGHVVPGVEVACSIPTAVVALRAKREF